MVEQLIRNQQVTGSTPARSTILISNKNGLNFFFSVFIIKTKRLNFVKCNFEDLERMQNTEYFKFTSKRFVLYFDILKYEKLLLILDFKW